MAGTTGHHIWARFTKETVWGTPKESPTAADIFWVVFQEGASFDLNATPAPFDIMTAGSPLARRLRRHHVRKTVQGSLSTPVWPTQMKHTIGMAYPSVVGGRLTLPSYTVDFCKFGVAAQSVRYTGVRCQRLEAESSPQNDMLMANLTLIGKEEIPGVTLAEPNMASAFPSEIPFTHYHSGGQIEVDDAIISDYRSIRFTIDNTVDAPHNESQWVSYINLINRNSSSTIVVYKKDEGYRAIFEAASVVDSCKIAYLNSTLGYGFELDLLDANYLSDYSVERNFDTDQYETINLDTFLDTTAANDLVLSFTEPSPP
jgi:hypothetical protein